MRVERQAANTTKEPNTTTSSFKTNNSFEMAAADIAVVKVTQPVFDTKVEPGNADNKALAFCLGSI